MLFRSNARFNLMKLGVDVTDYLPNFYGEMADALNAGDESDRLLVSWKTDTQAVQAKEISKLNLELCKLIAIPEDIVEIRRKDKSESMKWRLRVRTELKSALDNGGKIIGFTDKNEYVLHI